MMSWAFLTVACTAVPAYAYNDAGLYAAAPPPNSVFVRIISDADDAKPVDAVIGKAKYSAANGMASPYKVVPAGKVSVTAAGGNRTVSFVSGNYYTVVVSGARGKPTINSIQDPKLDSKVKGLITFYNLTGRSALTLKTADGKANVVERVASGQVGARQVNSATIGFAVFDGANALGKTAPQTVNRGNAYSSIVTDAGGRIKVIWVRNETSK
ncbi:hypothetical protein ABAC402_15500 [Asticcacaulis sp. AC402]|nr:hypothetical protein ABAC402_15500 [Asticcacaulis sp. AC402]